jgi:hypothetical protein
MKTREEVGNDLRSQGLASQVPSALAALTTGFGMGPGRQPPHEPPTDWFLSSRHPSYVKPAVAVRMSEERELTTNFQKPPSSQQTGSAEKPSTISMGKLTGCPAYTAHLSNGSSSRGLTCFHNEASHLGTCFLLRCFQQLSLPETATERCSWQNNSHTGAPSIPVLSY